MTYEEQVRRISIRVWGAYMDAIDKPMNYKQVKDAVAEEVLNIISEEVDKAFKAGYQYIAVDPAHMESDTNEYLLTEGLTTPTPKL